MEKIDVQKEQNASFNYHSSLAVQRGRVLCFRASPLHHNLFILFVRASLHLYFYLQLVYLTCNQKESAMDYDTGFSYIYFI